LQGKNRFEKLEKVG